MSNNKDMWYSPNRLLSHNAFLNICLSPRGNGKTYSAKDKIIKNWLRKGKQAVYLRRYKTELEDMKDTFFDDIKEKYPEHEFEVKGFEGYIDGEVVVFFIALTTSPNLKSKAFPNVDLIIFDEYVITKTNHTRYLRNEVNLLFDLIETVMRVRDNGVILILGNALSFVNPLFSFFDIVPDDNKRFQKYKNGLICLELFKSHVFIEKKKDTRFGKLIAGTKYGDYAIENKTLEDTSDFIKPRGSYKYNYVCTFKYESFKIGVWYNMDLNEYFCDEIVDLSCIHKFTMKLEELEEGYYYYKNYKNLNYKLKNIKNASAEGNIFFTSQEIKKVMIDSVLPYL